MKNIRILFIGDVVARPGRRTIDQILPDLRAEFQLDLVVANAENLAGGRGITGKTLMEMQRSGVDFFTGGHHLMYRPGWESLLADDELKVIRPLNYEDSIPGVGYRLFEHSGYSICLVNLEGQEMMPYAVRNGFQVMESFINESLQPGVLALVDFHAELTSEKRAMGFFLDGKFHGVVGTHTHVPTVDVQVLPSGTFYVTDLGMVGVRDSVLGVNKRIIINRFKDGIKDPFAWEQSGETVFNSVLVEYNENFKVVDYRRVDRVIP